VSDQLRPLDREEVGRRVALIRRLSGLTGQELHRRLESRSAALVTQLERGESRVIERIHEIANACSGEFVLREATPEQIAHFLYCERDDVPLAWPFDDPMRPFSDPRRQK
jgi:hypothetical protein